MSESLLFESDGMCSNEVSQQTPRQVLLCFLDVARIFGRRSDYKGALPDLVKFEQVIIFYSYQHLIFMETSEPLAIFELIFSKGIFNRKLEFISENLGFMVFE